VELLATGGDGDVDIDGVAGGLLADGLRLEERLDLAAAGTA
jgi:hypothetical protein